MPLKVILIIILSILFGILLVLVNVFIFEKLVFIPRAKKVCTERHLAYQKISYQNISIQPPRSGGMIAMPRTVICTNPSSNVPQEISMHFFSSNIIVDRILSILYALSFIILFLLPGFLAMTQLRANKNSFKPTYETQRPPQNRSSA
jgi:hypothetical protein